MCRDVEIMIVTRMRTQLLDYLSIALCVNGVAESERQEPA